ncbi:MAG: hypothetical protein QME66_03950 [Candidatus Eisenbacteria bacterium]|nr:hypothetical protein [Candidatus Eisenbacteria bacterium]
MNRQKIAKILSIIVMVAGIMVMAGWIFDIGILKSILPTWITMKFSTALCFFLSGLTVYFIAKSQEAQSGFAQVILPLASLTILLFMALLLASCFLRVRLGIEDLFIKEVQEATSQDWIAGRPSIATMMEFIIIAIAGILNGDVIGFL